MDKKFRTVRGYEMQGYNRGKLTHAMEDYLEMIYRTSLKESYIRINSLAHMLNVKASSVSKMVQKLGMLGLVNYTKYEAVTLTPEGERIGKYLLNRHEIIERFLLFIGSTSDILVQAELMEHIVSSETVQNIKILYDFMHDNKDVLTRYRDFLKSSKFSS